MIQRRRNPERIGAILKRLQSVWESCPDLRLGQLICNVRSDPYFIEDAELLKELERFYKERKE